MLIITSHREDRGTRRCTLLELVQEVTAGTASDAECVAVIGALLKSGRTVLTGSFKGQILD
jgi:hypothetical protein